MSPPRPACAVGGAAAGVSGDPLHGADAVRSGRDRIGKRHPVPRSRDWHGAATTAGYTSVPAIRRAQLLDDAHNRRRHLHFGRLLARLGRPGWSNRGLPGRCRLAAGANPGWCRGLDAALAPARSATVSLHTSAAAVKRWPNLRCSGLSSPDPQPAGANGIARPARTAIPPSKR